MLNFRGEGGIRTPGTVARTTVFETATIDRSATSPEESTREGARGSAAFVGCRGNPAFAGQQK